MSSRARSSKSAKMSSSLMPPARYSSTSYTVIRVPLTHGFPPRTERSTVIRSCQLITGLYVSRRARVLSGEEAQKRCDRLGWAAVIIDLGLRHRAVNVARMHRTDLDQILFGILPREFSARPGEAPEIVTELRAFWRFIQREFEPVFATDCLELLERPDLAAALRRKLAKPAP